MTDDCLLSLLAPPEVTDELTDWLLAFHGELTFTSQPVAEHGLDPEAMAQAEQVTGRQRRLLVRVRTDTAGARRLVAELGEDFGAAGLTYWIVPLLGHGRIGAPEQP
jgi:hypothetical protein